MLHRNGAAPRLHTHRLRVPPTGVARPGGSPIYPVLMLVVGLAGMGGLLGVRSSTATDEGGGC